MPRWREHHFHIPYHVDTSPTMRILFVIRFLRDLFGKLATFFVPIYLYQQVVAGALKPFFGDSSVTQAVVAICVYFALYRLVSLVMTFPAAQCARRFGHRTTLLLSHLFLAGFALALFFSRYHPAFLLASAVFEGIQVAFFWPSYYTLITRAARREHIGEDLGLIQFLLKLGSLVTPAVGSLIIVLFGFHTVFLAGLLIISLIGIATLFMEKEPEKDAVSWGELRRWMREESFLMLIVSYAGRYVHDAMLVLWPVYVFLFLGSVTSVGYLYTLSLFLALLISFFGGVYIDHTRSKKPFYLTGAVLSGLWVVRALIGNFWHILTIDTLEKLASDFHWLCYDAFCLRRGSGSQAFSFFVYREIVISVSALLLWLLMAIVFSLLRLDWTGLFMFAAIGVLLSLTISDTYKKNL